MAFVNSKVSALDCRADIPVRLRRRGEEVPDVHFYSLKLWVVRSVNVHILPAEMIACAAYAEVASL